CRQRIVKRSNRPAVRSEREDRPSEAPRRRKSWSNTFQVLHCTLYNRVLSSIIQCQQSNRRVVDVRRHGASIDNTVTRIPSSARAGTIEKHLDAAVDPYRDALKTTARARDLL